MAASIIDGPWVVYGPTAAVQAAVFGSAVADPDTDAGPSILYQGTSWLDPRYYFPKDQVTGNSARVPSHYNSSYSRSVAQIPAALSASNIAAAQNATSGTAMTLVSTASLGVALNIPIIPFSQGGINQLPIGTNPTVAPITLDFGYAFGNCTSGNAIVTVANSLDFPVGMPVVIAGVGNSGGTVPLLTNVVATSTQFAGTQTITLATAPLATNSAAPIGTGNIWSLRLAPPTAALPWFKGGVGLALDTRQTICRGVQIVGVTGGTGGTFTVKGWDLYGVPMTETITVGAGAVTGWGVKAFKYILSVTPNFTDAHNYTVGTSDTFGVAYRGGLWEDYDVSWNATLMTTTTGWVAPLSLNTAATATTADVRGTFQVSASGASGTGISANASNGTVSSLAMTGRRLMVQQTMSIAQVVYSNPMNFATLFGVTQF